MPVRGAMKKISKPIKNVKTPEYDLGERLRFFREIRKLTQKELAQMAGISQATIAHIEKSTKDPSVDTLKRLAAALDTHVATLFATQDVFVFDLKRLRRKYQSADKLTPHLYMSLGRVLQFARDIKF
jgi:transcriptional regulator with XRE-family HTH domain